jgi:hypothetical protein
MHNIRTRRPRESETGKESKVIRNKYCKCRRRRRGRQVRKRRKQKIILVGVKSEKKG